MKLKLDFIGLTYGDGEVGTVTRCIDLLDYMRATNKIFPKNDKETDELLANYIIYDRVQSMEHLRDSGKITPEVCIKMVKQIRKGKY